MKKTSKLLTVAQAAAVIGVSHRQARQYIQDGRLPALRVTPRFFLVAEADAKAFVRPAHPGLPSRK